MKNTESTSLSAQIKIHVETAYLVNQSDPDNSQYVFSYTITIKNEASMPVKLISRHWIITDANGHIQEVKGDGVVGEQPSIKPGESYQYSSGAILNTPIGSMEGSYQMIDDNAEHFDVEIPAFGLAVPHLLH